MENFIPLFNPSLIHYAIFWFWIKSTPPPKISWLLKCMNSGLVYRLNSLFHLYECLLYYQCKNLLHKIFTLPHFNDINTTVLSIQSTNLNSRTADREQSLILNLKYQIWLSSSIYGPVESIFHKYRVNKKSQKLIIFFNWLFLTHTI